MGAGCNDVFFAEPAPHFRGITVPLPPPSFAAQPQVAAELEGNIGTPLGAPTIVSLWRDDDPVGLSVAAQDSGDFEFPEVEITLDQTCIELYFEVDDGAQARPSQHAFYQVVTMSDEACTDDAFICSAVDLVGDCVCLDERASGC